MTITVYSKPRCINCTATYRALDSRGIKYEVVDYTQDEAVFATVAALGYLEAPVVVAGDQHWSGYKEDKIDALAAQLAA